MADGSVCYSYIAAASANQDAKSVKAAPGQLFGFDIVNVAATVRWVKLYNKAAPTSADTPVRRIGLQANQSLSRSLTFGQTFPTAIGLRITTGEADNDATAATAGDVVVNLDIR